MSSKSVSCLKCQSGMRRVSIKRDAERWRCEQCGAEQTIRRKPHPDDPRIAKPK